MILVPDQDRRAVYERRASRRASRPGKTLIFAHGFNIHFGRSSRRPDVDVVMVAPKGPGHLRARACTRRAAACPAWSPSTRTRAGKALAIALAYARGIGCTRAGVIETTFKEETETDLFGEQAVLCGGVTALVKAGFETLVEAGYQPEIAYFECLHELKLIVDLMYRGGISATCATRSATPPSTATTPPARASSPTRRSARCSEILDEIQNGEFAQRVDRREPGRPAGLQRDRARPSAPSTLIEEVGASCAR